MLETHQKLTLIAVAVVLGLVGLKWVEKNYDAVDANVNQGGQIRIAERHGIIGSDFGQGESPKKSPPSPLPSFLKTRQ